MGSPGKIKVAVVFGGRSGEHAISCLSAGSLLRALDPDEFEVLPVGITREGRWVLGPSDAGQLAVSANGLPEVTEGTGQSVVLAPDPTTRGVQLMEPTDGVRVLADVDVVFPLLHGAYGEDGTIQGLLEMAGLPYVGAGVFASAAGMDKEFAKKLVAAEGIPVGPFVVLRAGQSLSVADQERLGLPVFVKPSRAGSSLGITRVDDWSALEAAVAVAREIDPKVLVESAIIGREVECGVLEGEHGGPPESSLPGEVRIDAQWYDFQAKYRDEVSYDIPAKLPTQVSTRLQEYATRAFLALDCAGLARVDFFVTPDFEVYLSEVNTMPGFTPMSAFPQLWAASGLDYPKLASRLIRTALARGTGLR